MPIGDRALDLLIALTERPSEVVSKPELMSRIWPDTHVDEVNLRAQVATLRRALGHDGEAYVANAPGRGYRFVAPVERETSVHERLERWRPWSRLSEPVGREAEIADVLRRLTETRLLTIVGPGGIGKTTLAFACMRALEAGEADGVAFAEVSDVADLTMAIAGSLGVRLADDDGLAALSAYLAPLELLLVLDSCEYAIEAAAGVAEAILRQAPKVKIIATSREPLRAESEVVWRLEPLATPPGDRKLTAAEAIDYAAVRLFVDRASASDRSFRLTNDTASTIVNICRRLDGLPLAIELAAGRIGSYGLAGIEAGLDNRFQMLGEGRRTGLPRHQTMAAAIDWSYVTLNAEEQRALRRLSLFQSPFDAAAAAHLFISNEAPPGAAIEVLSSLVSKSLVLADTTATPVEYRLLDTTRDYARAKLEDEGEASGAAARHAAQTLRVLADADTDLDSRSMQDWLEYYARKLEDGSAALDWACSPTGDRSIAVALTIAAIPVWARLNWTEERRRRIEAALAIVEPDTSNELALNAALAAVMFYLPLDVPSAEAVTHRAITLARLLQDSEAEIRSQWLLCSTHLRAGLVAAARADVAHYLELVSVHGGPFERLVADRMVAYTELVAGNLALARSATDRVLSATGGPDARKRLNWYAYDPDVRARNALVSLLWLEGKPETALSVAEDNFDVALAHGNNSTTCMVLTDAICPLALHIGDVDMAERYLAQLDGMILLGEASVIRHWASVFRATLAAVRGNPQPSLAMMAHGLPTDADDPRFTSTLIELAVALGKAGRGQEARRLADDLLQRVESKGEGWMWSEVQRVRGELSGDPKAAESLFEAAIETARAQGARAWALRAATSLARLRPDKARDMLAPWLETFTEGFQTKDLISARAALQQSA